MKLSKININLLFLIVTAILFQIFLFTQKENFHIDEMLSFIAANNDEGIYLFQNWSDTDNVFIEGKDFTKILTKQPDGLSLTGVWRKISQGVHMPIFYVLLNAFYFTGNVVFSPLSGFLINIVVLLFLLIGFYKLADLIFKNKNIATVVTGIFSFSQAVLSLEVYIRMYLLLMAFSVWLLYFTGKYFLFNKKRDLFFVLFLTFLIVLTHYYSLIFCFLITSFVCLYFLLEKEYKNMFVFGFVMLCAVVAAYLSFPTMIDSGFHSERGSQFWVILSEFKENPIKILSQQIPLFTDTIFMNFWLFGVFVFSFGLCWYENETLQNKYIWVLFFVFLCYGFLTALVMPVMLHYQVRYFAPIIPIFILLIGYMIIRLGDKYNFSQKSVFIVLCVVMFILGIKNIIWQDNPFYMHGTRNSRKMENLVKGADVWWGFGGGWQYTWMLTLYVDKLAKANKTWILADYYHPKFIEFSNQEVKDKKYAYLFMPKTQEQKIVGAINWIKETTGRNAYYLFTSKTPNSSARVFEASVYLVCPF